MIFFFSIQVVNCNFVLCYEMYGMDVDLCRREGFRVKFQ